jgi:hypothetical protein
MSTAAPVPDPRKFHQADAISEAEIKSRYGDIDVTHVS